MNLTDIGYFLENQSKIYEEFNEFEKTLPLNMYEKLLYSLNNCDIDEAYNIINTISSSNIVTYSSLKMISFIFNPNKKDKIFSKEEFSNLLKNLVDNYSNKILEIINVKDKDFSINILNPLLSFKDSKYVDFYKMILNKKLTDINRLEDITNILKNSDSRFISEELIKNILEKNISDLNSSDIKKFLQILPSSILTDGFIVKKLLKNVDCINFGDEEIFDYIQPIFENTQLISEALDKAQDFEKAFYHVPLELKTKEIWEKACSKGISYLNQIPNENMDFSITQEEYTFWLENLIVKNVIEDPKLIVMKLMDLDDSKKNSRVCQNIAKYITISTDMYSDFFKYIPDDSKTLELYEILIEKFPEFLKKIPSLKAPNLNITQEEYDKWFENIILKNIENCKNMDEMYKLTNHYIPREKITENVWNKILDECIKKDFYREKCASIRLVKFKNLTYKMLERAIKNINNTEIFLMPCIDEDDPRNFNNKEIEEWKKSLTDEEKQLYRDTYEKIWIKYCQENNSLALYDYVPENAITKNMNKACIDISYNAIKRIPLPKTINQLKDYQEYLILALNKVPTLNYQEQIKLEDSNLDILKDIPKEYISENVIDYAIKKNPIYLTYLDPNTEDFSRNLDIAFKNKLISLGRNELTKKEKELIQKYFINNSELFKTLKLEILTPEIINFIGEKNLERIVRYPKIEDTILNIAKDERLIKVFSFALNNLKMNNVFIEPFIEKLSKSICSQDSKFLDVVSERINNIDKPYTDYEKAIISYLLITPEEGKNIKQYDDILSFVERKDNELEDIINNDDSSLLEVKNAYLEKLVGLNYNNVSNLITTYGNDPEILLQNYNNIDSKSFKQLAEKESLEIIIKLKSLIQTQDINEIRNSFKNFNNFEENSTPFLRYQNASFLEDNLRRAYGRDVVKSLSKNDDFSNIQELKLNGEKYFVKKLDKDFYKMVSLLGAYRKSTTTDGDMYDRWNTNEMANNHALCYSLINQSNPGTAMIGGKKGIIISISNFSPDSVLAAAPYDLSSDNRENTIFTLRQKRFFSIQNMSNQTRSNYSEYDIEIEDVDPKNQKYHKIQPSSIICFEEIDEDSIKAAIELGKKLGYPVPIELIDRRELANSEMQKITEAFNNFKNAEDINTNLVKDIITRFNNVRNAHNFSSLSSEILGEDIGKEEEKAPFNKKHLNQMLKECISNIESRIINGKVDDGLEALKDIKNIISDEREKSFLQPTSEEKQLWSGIDLDVDFTISEIERKYIKNNIQPLEQLQSLEIFSQMFNRNFSSPTFDAEFCNIISIPQQFSVREIEKFIDLSKIYQNVNDVYSEGYYQNNTLYDIEHIGRVILYSDIISKMEGFDDKTRDLTTEVAKYYSCGRQIDSVEEEYEKYSAQLAAKDLDKKYSKTELNIIQAAIELQNFKSKNQDELINKRKMKFIELCDKYSLDKEASIIVDKIASCIGDSVILDQTRFVDKITNNGNLNKRFFIGSLELSSSNKLVEFSYSLQDQLAQKELDKFSNVVKIQFDKDEKEKIMKDFFTDFIGFNERQIKDPKITESPIVRLEYLKTNYPEILNIDLRELENQIKIKKNESKLKTERKNLIHEKYKERISKLEKSQDSFLTLDQLLQQQFENDLMYAETADLKSKELQR